MADTVKRIQYYYTEVTDRPGQGAKVMAALKEIGRASCRERV